MAVSANALTSGSSTTSAASFATASVTPGANRLVLLSVTSTGPSSATPNQPTATGNGLTWVAVASVTQTSGTNRLRTTVLRAMGAPSAGAITIDFAAQNQRGVIWSVIEYTGVDTSGSNGSGAVPQSATFAASGSAASVLMPGLAGPDNRVHAAVGHQANEASTPATEITELHDVAIATQASDLAAGWGTYLYTGNLFTWATSSGFCAVLVELKADTGAQPEAYPALTLQLSTAAPGSAPAWVNITPYLHAGDTKRGRTFELDRVEAGTANFTVLNSDRRFDPTYTGGPYYPNLLPLRRIRLRALWSGTTYALFDGYLESIDQIWPAKGAPVAFATLKCIDGFEILARRILTSTYAVGSYDQMSFTTRQLGSTLGPSGDGRAYGYGWARPGSPAGSAASGPITIQGIVDAGADPGVGNVEISGNTIIDRYQAGSAPTGRRAIRIIGDINSSIAGNIVQASLVAGADGQTHETNWSVTLAFQFAQERSDLRVKRVLDQIGWPAADRVLRTGTATVQQFEFHPADNVTPLQHCQDVSATELGVLFMDGQNRVVFLDRDHRTVPPYSASQATVSDDPAAYYSYVDLNPAYDSRYLYNKITVTRNGGNAMTASDATSITAFLTRELNLSTISSADTDSQNIANALLAKYKDIKMRYQTLQLVPDGAQSPNWRLILGFDISTRITVQRTPPGSSQRWSQDCYIESVALTFDRHMQNTRCQWELSPA